MNITTIEIQGTKPEAFKDRDEIEYVHIVLEGFEFMNWGRFRIDTCFQVPTGMRDLDEVLNHVLSKFIPLNRMSHFEISITDELLTKSGFKMDLGEKMPHAAGRSWNLQQYDAERKRRNAARSNPPRLGKGDGGA